MNTYYLDNVLGRYSANDLKRRIAVAQIIPNRTRLIGRRLGVKKGLPEAVLRLKRLRSNRRYLRLN